MKKTIVVLLTVFVFSTNAFSYGPRGHNLVGAIADRRLAQTQSGTKVSQLLDGLTLERVATIPDEIKSWDRCEKSENPSGSIAGASKRINAELRAFVKANSCNSAMHDDFHFTNIPVTGDEEYADGEVGRRENDIVQMILFCVRVLNGDESQPNDRAITKSVAVILLAHYVGDIHQPLHVAAEFFDADGAPIQPTPANEGFGDQGGNKLTLFTLRKGKLVSAGKFHGYWDSQTVENAFGSSPNPTVAKKLGNKEPTDWKLTGNVESWGEKLANDILPLAREARTRLSYSEIETSPG
ncbi:MAG TPA: S1/P1 nuclease, partial [Pyrinomonadaceae bacterium]